MRPLTVVQFVSFVCPVELHRVYCCRVDSVMSAFGTYCEGDGATGKLTVLRRYAILSISRCLGDVVPRDYHTSCCSWNSKPVRKGTGGSSSFQPKALRLHMQRRHLEWSIDNDFNDCLAIRAFPSLCSLKSFLCLCERETMSDEFLQIDCAFCDQVDRLWAFR